MKDKIKAVALFSGGLDSILALKLIQEQGIEVKGVNFKTPFFGLGEAFVIVKDLDINLKIIDITEELLKILKKPKYGFGKNMNPCIDCHALMFKKAGEYMNKIGASFILSGEVLGERPMSQNRDSLSIIERESGFEGKILRPLSALLLTETIPEKGGLVDRNKLLDISGRSRKRQIKLADEMGIKDYPSPAGGCKLTEPAFSKRLRDLFTQESFSLEEIELLKLGRHFRLSKDIKLVVGRNKEENEQLQNFFQDGDFLFKAKNLKGPVSLLKKGSKVNNELIDKSCQITARYCDRNEEENEEVNINYYYKSKELVRTIKVKPLIEDKLEILRIQG
ncbi:MAG: tRNA 4-thiouridine(8) synthase ThiI [Candidatus Atribacteria bacterium]|nr:tRNA 4-thiouridine(8) synthase ThiI [Candidatus Atribacteria bacterium]MBE3093290.1 tRNA 4-thiouridine(8) synthase ThiI [Chloroflexota bacterium]MBE3127498.1 tRNA 4-thiouridine(8) synthase ThiI [Candidatus Atribacteria bacterium]